MVARYRALDLPTYWAGVNVDLNAHTNTAGALVEVQATYPRDPVRQYLNYAKMFNPGFGR